jgi:hypothetical protein
LHHKTGEIGLLTTCILTLAQHGIDASSTSSARLLPSVCNQPALAAQKQQQLIPNNRYGVSTASTAASIIAHHQFRFAKAIAGQAGGQRPAAIEI